MDKQSFSFPSHTQEMRNFAYPKLALIKVATSEETHTVLNALRNQLIQTFEGVKKNLQLKIANDYFQEQMDQAIEELRRFNPGRCTMITVSPNETKALIAAATATMPSHWPPI